ncbi:hypothetical protein [Pedobacter sp. MR22-3]|uniref:hypothetical protein n=1 Tax=Pedobacter TaxID=84567 RepID=UPI0022472A3D|nr:hypothetical protein [Pedobacter sp. MR22-3]
MAKVTLIFSVFLLLSSGHGQENSISRITDYDTPENLAYIEHEQGKFLVKNNYSYFKNVKNTRHMFVKGTIQWLEIIRQTRMQNLSLKLKSSKLKIPLS